jgi:hypothetical protein
MQPAVGQQWLSSLDLVVVPSYIRPMASDDSRQELHRWPRPGADGAPQAPGQPTSRTTKDRLRSRSRPEAVTALVAVSAIAALGAVFLNRDGTPGMSPEQVVRQYVRAKLADRDDVAAASLSCQTPQLQPIEEWQQDLAAREARFHLRPLQVEVASYSGSTTRKHTKATVEIAVTQVVDGRPQARITRPYEVILVQDKGWKVCETTARS